VSPGEIQVGYFGRSAAAHIAREHHYGLSIKGKKTSYNMPERQLLGFNSESSNEILDAVLEYLKEDL
jgi:phage gpG-like protein